MRTEPTAPSYHDRHRPNQTMEWYYNEETAQAGHLWGSQRPVRILGTRGHTITVLTHDQWTGELVWRDANMVVLCDDPAHPMEPGALIAEGTMHEVTERPALNPIGHFGGAELERPVW